MPSSKSSVDNRDVYYRLGKSAGYRARSAYKLLHLDEEFDLFTGVKTAVDLCAAPGSWSQVLAQKLKPGKKEEDPKVVSIDLQPMAPLPNITILQTDITLPSTIPLVLNALGGRKADLVVCDGAPDGVHDLDAYLHSQLLLAALTLSLTLLAPGATLIFKIFLSPMDPQAAMLRSQLQPFFPAQSSETLSFAEFDEEGLADQMSENSGKASAAPARSGVWVRKPRSSRKGSGEAFIVCRNFDPSSVPLPVTFSPEALADLAKQTTGTLTLESLVNLTSEGASLDGWEKVKSYVGSGDLACSTGIPPSFVLPPAQKTTKSPRQEMSLFLNTESVSRQSSVRSIRELHPQPTPCDEPDEYFGPGQNTNAEAGPSNYLDPARGLEQPKRKAPALTVDPSRQTSIKALTTPTSASSADRPWEKNTTPLPTPRKFGSPDGLLSAREWDIARSTPREDGAISPALSSGSKTDLFFASAQNESLPTPPPRPIGRAPSLGKGLPSGIRGHDRSVSLPVKLAKDDTEILLTPPSTIEAIGRPNGLFHRDFEIPTTSRAFIDNVVASPSHSLPRSANPPRRPVLHTRRESQQLPRELREVTADSAELHPGDILTPTNDDRRWPAEPTAPWKLIKPLGQGAFSSVWSAQQEVSESGPNRPSIAAVKLTSRATCESNSRTRIAFLREVSVLRHLSHPNIVSFFASFSTASHHCLVLEQLSGGELFELMSEEVIRERMHLPGPGDEVGEGFARRLFGELCKGVGWLHEVGVVHRDIKLENILLTVNPFELPPTSTGSIPLDLLPSPLVKLTDFGLSRFINPSSPSLQTRCGSESFAAPEIIMGKTYDGRETDAWAMGVVLYALITGELPFDGAAEEGANEREERKRKMMRIAKGIYTWPEDVGSEGARNLVGKLLTREAKKRLRVGQAWKEEWMRGLGEVTPPTNNVASRNGENAEGGPIGPIGLRGKSRRILDGFLLDEEVEAEASAEAI